MAHSRSARKRVRTAARRTEINRARRSRVRTYIKKVEAAVEAGDQDAARAALVAAQPEIMRGVTNPCRTFVTWLDKSAISDVKFSPRFWWRWSRSNGNLSRRSKSASSTPQPTSFFVIDMTSALAGWFLNGKVSHRVW